MTDAIHHTGIIGLMRGRDAFENRRFEGGGFIELLPFEYAQSFTDDIGFVGIASGVNKPIHKLIQRGRKGDCHKKKDNPQRDSVQTGFVLGFTTDSGSMVFGSVPAKSMQNTLALFSLLVTI
jgi:hypothetical protein